MKKIKYDWTKFSPGIFNEPQGYFFNWAVFLFELEGLHHFKRLYLPYFLLLKGFLFLSGITIKFLPQSSPQTINMAQKISLN